MCKYIFTFLFFLGFSTVLQAGETYSEIEELVQRNPGQLSVAEYSLIAETLTSHSPCNMLVFGLGNDSDLWHRLNQHGTTLFLENNAFWYDKICTDFPQVNALLVEYNTTRPQWKSLLKRDKEEELLLDLPSHVWDTKWDLIFVDAPEGWADDKPGRMQSIYTAAKLASKSGGCHIFVHDCHRKVEAAFSSKYLGDRHLQCELDRLRHYYVKGSSMASRPQNSE
ncbi:MAG: TIGR01627 domain-containing protein [Verrucomicrobia bacterium]|nr:TIGR01627 domain-containing protein [Verrucomicrobiota bacterium]